MSRFAHAGRVFFVEEPVAGPGPAHLEVSEVAPNLWVCTPHIDPVATRKASEAIQRHLIRMLVHEREIARPVLWFYTPMALPLVTGVDAALVVYDCMDELSGFHGAPPELVERERELFAIADLVFTGGQSLYDAKRSEHASVFAFPSSVDASHFALARRPQPDPADQREIPPNRLGFFGVIDERMDLGLIDALARARPDYQIVMLGPVVKIPESSLPRLSNLHYLGSKPYHDLPAYIAGWRVALMPFALNAATRFISPTKTLEYLAAGKPVVATAVRDVVSPYGEAGVVRIADEASFPGAVDAAMATDMAAHLEISDRVLERTSWDQTWCEMLDLMVSSIDSVQRNRARARATQGEGRKCSTTL